jgi:prepilin-type N-terminal cleavage/methylation domain-containing protein
MREAITMKMQSNALRLRAQSDTTTLSSKPPQFLLPLLARPRQQGGFTLIESLVAIIILSLTVVSVFPPIFWATATRVQNRRAEQAIQLAQSEIDRVRVAVERNKGTVGVSQLPPKVGATLKPDAPAPTTIAAGKLRSAVPGCNNDDGNQAINVGDVILVDTDPEPPGSTTPCAPEFMVQTFRGTGVPTDDALTAPDGFVMGVRVYSINARKSIEAGTAQKGPGTLRAGNGLGTQQFKPLTTQYSTIVRANKSDSLGIYRQLCTAAGQACEAKPN